MNTPHILGSDASVPIFNELPDSRCKERNTRQGPAGIMSKVYCANCGADGGLITEEFAAKVFYLCDRCAETYGKLPDSMEVSEAVVRGEQKPNEIEKGMLNSL